MLVAATNNRKKLRELLDILEPLGVPVRSSGDYLVPAPEETGGTFEANALIKALATFRATGEVTLADDSGLEVDALAGAPGVDSAYYAGPSATDDENNSKLVAALHGVENRAARYRAVLVVVVPEHLRARVPAAREVDGVWVVTSEGSVDGEIIDTPRGEGGFGYDPHFFYPPAGLTFAELDADAKHAVSHRGRALAQLRPTLEALFR